MRPLFKLFLVFSLCLSLSTSAVAVPAPSPSSLPASQPSSPTGGESTATPSPASSTQTTTTPIPAAPVEPDAPSSPTVASEAVTLRLVVGNKKMIVNDKSQDVDVAPVIKDGRTLVPVRYLAEPLGADVLWDPDTQAVTILSGSNKIVLWIGKPDAEVNGVKKRIDPANASVTPLIKDGRTLMPMRFIAETLGMTVDWKDSEKSITMVKAQELQKPATDTTTTTPVAGYNHVHGTLKDSRSGMPVTAYELSLTANSNPPYNYTITTGSDGSFQFDIPQGSSYTLTNKGGFYEQKAWLITKAGEYTLSLGPNSPPESTPLKDGYYRVYGHLKDKGSGAALADVRIEAKGTTTKGVSLTSYYVTDSVGFFFIDWPKWETVSIVPRKAEYKGNGIALDFPDTRPSQGEGGPRIVTRTSPELKTLDSRKVGNLIQQDLTLEWIVPEPLVKKTQAQTQTQTQPQVQVQQNWGTLNFTATWGVFFVFLDDRFIGQNPILGRRISVGTHHLEAFNHAGQRIIDKWFVMKAGGTQSFK